MSLYVYLTLYLTRIGGHYLYLYRTYNTLPGNLFYLYLLPSNLQFNG
jgi:hypothetical protein